MKGMTAMSRKKAGPETNPDPQANGTTPLSREGLRLKRKLTLDLTSIGKLTHNGEAIFRCDSEMMQMSLPSHFSVEGRALAWVIDITGRYSGEKYLLPCPAVLASNLARAGEPLMGRWFAVTMGEQKPGKRYRDMQVDELEEDE
jgi:hypothetical protein